MSATEVNTNDGGMRAVPEVNTEPELSKDKIFHLLQTPRRRHALRYLKDNDGVVEMRDLAEQVAAWENETTVQALTSEERQRVYIPLYQSHLPKLDEEGIIEYNQSRGTVKRTKLADQLDRYLTVEKQIGNEEEPARQVSWELYYLGVSVFSTILLAGAILGVSVLTAVPSVAIGGGIVAMFLFVTLAQVMAERAHRR